MKIPSPENCGLCCCLYVFTVENEIVCVSILPLLNCVLHFYIIKFTNLFINFKSQEVSHKMADKKKFKRSVSVNDFVSYMIESQFYPGLFVFYLQKEEIAREFNLPERKSKIDSILKNDESKSYCICRTSDSTRFMMYVIFHKYLHKYNLLNLHIFVYALVAVTFVKNGTMVIVFILLKKKQN